MQALANKNDSMLLMIHLMLLVDQKLGVAMDKSNSPWPRRL